MAELTITIKDSDVDYLAEIAEREWRHPEQQASALLEQALDARRVRISTNDKLRIRAAERSIKSTSTGRSRAQNGEVSSADHRVLADVTT